MIRTGVGVLALGLLLAGPLLAEDLPTDLPEEFPEESGSSGPSAQEPAEQEDTAKRVYRTVGKDGSVTFTDQGGEGQEEIEIRAPNTVDISVPAVAPAPNTDDADKPGAAASYQIEITRPKPEETFQNPDGALAVDYTLTPALREGDTVQVVVDGQVVEGKEIPRPARGEHHVSVRVVDASGAELAASGKVRFFVHRVSRLQ